MAKSLDFNKISRPVLRLTMLDEEKTIIAVSTPSEALIEELEAALPEIKAVAARGNKETIEYMYGLAAKLINYNRSFITVTAEELRKKYKLDLESLIIFFRAYIDFIGEIANAKN